MPGHPSAQSHVTQTATVAGATASKAEHGKITKYAQLATLNSLAFVPVAIETLGSWGPAATKLCRELGARMTQTSGDSRAHLFLLQRLGLAVQRGNAASVAGTHTEQDPPP